MGRSPFCSVFLSSYAKGSVFFPKEREKVWKTKDFRDIITCAKQDTF